MTYKPIPEHRRRELAKLIPELPRKFKAWTGPTPRPVESERDFWQRFDAPGVSPDRLVWLIRRARSAVGCIDPVQIQDFRWPKRCCLTGPRAHREGWPLEPIPDEPKVQPTPEGPLVDGAPVNGFRTLDGIIFDPKSVSRKLFDPAVLSTSITEEKPTTNQATPANAPALTAHALTALTVDTSNIVEVKTFVFGRDIATLDDDLLLNYVERLTSAVEHLEGLNARTPLAKLVTKIAQLKDARAKIVDLLGGAPPRPHY